MNQKETIQYLIDLGEDNLHGRVVGLVGDLGVGKTFFVKSFVGSLAEEIADQVNSPTYNLCNVYSVNNLEIHHYDLFRIESSGDLYDTGIFDSIENGVTLVFIEWVNLFPALVKSCDEVVTINSNGKEDPSFCYMLDIKN